MLLEKYPYVIRPTLPTSGCVWGRGLVAGNVGADRNETRYVRVTKLR